MDFLEADKCRRLLQDLNFNIFRNIYDNVSSEVRKRGLAINKLNKTEREIIIYLFQNKTCRVGELARAVGISTRSVHRPVGRLKDWGYLITYSDPKDKKCVITEITPNGRKLLDDNGEVATEVLEGIFNGKLDAAEQEEMWNAVIRIRRALEKLDE